MRNFNNKSGFTLIEIIVVLIIVGILAAIALPNLFQNVAKSRSAEALTTAETFRTEFEACEQANLSTGCMPTFQAGGGGTASPVGGVPDPDSPNVAFSFAAAPTLTSYSALTYTIVAASAQDATATINMTRNTSGTITCVGSGAWSGAC